MGNTTRYFLSNGVGADVQYSRTEAAMATCSYFDARRHEGNCFKFSDYHVLNASQARMVLMDIPSGTYIEAKFEIQTTGIAEAYFYRLSTAVSEGSTVTQCYNMNEESNKTTNVTFKEDPNGISGTILSRATSANGVVMNLGTWNLADNKKYVLRIYSRAATNYISSQITFIENSTEYEFSSESSSSSVGISSSSSVGVSSSLGLSSSSIGLSSSSIGLSSSSSVGVSSSSSGL